MLHVHDMIIIITDSKCNALEYSGDQFRKNKCHLSHQKLQSVRHNPLLLHFLWNTSHESCSDINKSIKSNTLFLKSLHIHLSLLKYEKWRRKLGHLKSLKNVHLSYSESVSGRSLYKYISPLYKNR